MGRADALKPGRHKDGHLLLARAELPIGTVTLRALVMQRVVGGALG